MARPFILTFGPWMPDGADVAFTLPLQYRDTPIPVADCQNVYFAQGAYRSLPALASTGSALGSQCLGASTALDSSGAAQIYAGAGSDLYHWNGAGWTSVSKSAGAYAGAAHWSMVEFAGCILAADGLHALQDATVGSGNFADIAAAPIGNVLGAIGQFVFVGDIPAAAPYRVQWCAIGDPTSWPTPLTQAAIAAQSSYEDLTQDFGAVQFIGGGPQMGVILQRLGITRAAYQGGDTVFSFLPVERKRGCIARGAAAQVGAVTHFIADDGFWMTDGSQSVPTGTNEHAALDKWFWNSVNQSALGAIRAGWDADKRCVAFAIPTGANTLPDTLVLLNPQSGQWTKAALACEMLWSDADGTRHRLGLIDQTHKLAYLTGAAPSGYCESYDIAFVDGAVRSVVEAQPQIVCTDAPTMRIGVKQAIDDAPAYSADAGRDSFTKRCTWDPPAEGMFVRARVTSAAAQDIHGATLYTETGGSV